MSKKRTPNFAELTDAEIQTLDPTTLGEYEAEAPEVDETDGVPSEADEADPVTPEEAGGADPSEGADEADSAELDAVEEDTEDDTRDPYSGNADDAPEDDQSKDKAERNEPAEDDDSESLDFEAAYKELMAPFRAARREVRLDNIEDARRLMQMGVDYSEKMRQMKPHLRILRTLEKAGLTDPDQVNFLIDLKKGDQNAIKKLLKDGSIDPMDLDLEGSESYKPNDHVIGDTELQLTEALDAIKDSPKYQDTLVVFDKMDTVSKQQLQGNPAVIPMINQHMEAGIYDKVWAKVEMERMLGRLAGLSDLDAYYTVGEAMLKAGAFDDPNAPAPSATERTAQGSAQGKGSPTGNDAAKRKAQKRAAAPTKGRAAQGGKKVPDLSKLSDAEIEKLDLSTLY